MQVFLPEGLLSRRRENTEYTGSESALFAAAGQGRIVEGRAVMCDDEHNLTVTLGSFRGIIPREEAALGIGDGSTREVAVLSRVGRPVAGIITDIISENGVLTPVLSRARAQQKCLDWYFSFKRSGDVIAARVTHLAPFGVFADIGCGVAALLPLNRISISRISHPSRRFCNGQDIFAVINCLDGTSRRITLTHRELLGTWEENAARFSERQTVTGIVRGIEPYGAFIELAPNLTGLAETTVGLEINDTVSVFIKSISPEKMKLKLAIVDDSLPVAPFAPCEYMMTEGHIDEWVYSTPGALRQIKSVF